MAKRMILTTLLVVSSLAVAVLISPRSANADGWMGWECKASLAGYPVSGGTMNGRVCANFWDGSAALWAVLAQTSTPFSYSIFTWAGSYESCDNGSSWFPGIPASSNTVYSATYGDSGSDQGAYTTCGSGLHAYKVGGVHNRKATSGAPVEGAYGEARF